MKYLTCTPTHTQYVGLTFHFRHFYVYENDHHMVPQIFALDNFLHFCRFFPLNQSHLFVLNIVRFLSELIEKNPSQLVLVENKTTKKVMEKVFFSIKVTQ